MNSEVYIEESWERVSHLIDGNFILLMTATDLETEALHKFIKPIYNYLAIVKTYCGSQTYYVGKFGNYKIAHVQCGMGSMSREGSILTATDAINIFKPKFLLMLGIAFGIDEIKQKIGDVLVSEAIIPYNFKRIGKKKTIVRSIPSPSSKTIVNRFKNLRTWEHFLNGNIKSDLICGHLLSGEELIDNKVYRDNLLKIYPTAKGGEMEGAGIISACDSKLEWIIVKGICDFADGNKSIDKEKNQTTAVNAAISACLEVFSSKAAFTEFDISPIEEGKYLTDIEVTEDINGILFDIYDSNYEQYYILRISDSEFNKSIAQYGLWLYGPTGCGKSNLILRNILVHKKQFIQISLASCVGQSIDEFFKEVLYELTAKTEGISNQIFPKSYKESHRAIINLLERFFPNKDFIIFIEEIPIEIDSEYKEFTEKMLSLLISKSYSSSLINVKFILSSINNPAKHVHLFQQKIFQQIKFIELKYWDNKDIDRLIELISKYIQCNLSDEFTKKLNQQSKGSPRFIKKFFRNVFSIGKSDEISLNEILQETERELNNN